VDEEEFLAVELCVAINVLVIRQWDARAVLILKSRSILGNKSKVDT